MIDVHIMFPTFLSRCTFQDEPVKSILEDSVVVTIKPDIILINETWTHQDITNAYLHIKGYELSARKDRTDTQDGRGVASLSTTKLI